jgi:hypothetical protein
MKKESNSTAEGFKRCVQESKGAYLVNLPMEIARAHGIVKGSKVKFFEKDGKIEIIPVTHSPQKKKATGAANTPVKVGECR